MITELEKFGEKTRVTSPKTAEMISALVDAGNCRFQKTGADAIEAVVVDKYKSFTVSITS